MPERGEPISETAAIRVAAAIGQSEPARPAARGMSRRIDHLGRIVLPVEYRRVLGIQNGDALELTLEGDAVAVRRVGPSCALCATLADLRPFGDRWVCEGCRRALSE